MNAFEEAKSGRRLGEFEIIREIGRGGMGIVYRARQLSLNREIALKVLSGGFELTRSAVQRFTREAEAAARLHHPSIIPIHATGEENGTHYYVMELVEGPSLQQVLEHLRCEAGLVFNTPPTAEADTDTPPAALPAWVTETVAYVKSGSAAGVSGATSDSALKSGSKYFDTVARMMADVADALEHAHTRAVIHRDIKPSNILLAPEGRLTLSDFGLARILDQPGVTITGEFVGTPMYMSPEQVAAGRVPIDHRTDIYSLGATLYEMLTLRPPYSGQQREQITAQVLQKDPTPPRRLNKSIPVDLQTICLKAMEKDPDRRFRTAGEMADDLRRFVQGQAIRARRPSLGTRLTKFVRRNRMAVTATTMIVLLAILAAAVTIRWLGVSWQRERQRVAREEWLPQVEAFLEAERMVSALRLAEQAEEVIPKDPVLTRLRPRLSVTASIVTEPAHVEVAIRDWQDADGPWVWLGKAPLENTRLPRGMIRWRFSKDGCATAERLDDVADGESWRVVLQAAAEVPVGMLRVTAGTVPEWGGLIVEDRDALVPNDFFIDKYEVTNADFQRFVDARGYQQRKYWQELIDELGDSKWEETVAILVDSTRKPGPATWANGTYPSAEDRHPVRGVSWYEAAAYARFVAKQLPTIHHWGLSANIQMARMVIPLSNYSTQGPAAVGTYAGISMFGAYDMAGNVKEWCWNALPNKRRYVLGGAWSDNPYLFVETEAYAASERPATCGFRCAKYPVPPPEKAFSEVPYLCRDFASETPATVAEFEGYRRLFGYDTSTPLNASAPRKVEVASPELDHEVVQVDTAPEGERLTLHIFLPRHVQPPFQTIAYVPGLDANIPQPFDATNSPGTWRIVTGLAQPGRAVCLPIFKGTFERHDGVEVYRIMRHQSIVYRNYVMQVSRELSRAIDYLETRRTDFACDRLAYVGSSWGALIGPVVTAVENRLGACVLIGGGFGSQRFEPEIDPFNFAPHVHVPTLMLNGRYDNIFLFTTEQQPLFRSLGTPADQTHHEVFETGHGLPVEQMIDHTHAWLNRYFGPVAPAED